jgi:hypothetical protein
MLLSFSSVKNQCIPKGSLVTHLDIQRLENRLGGVGHDLPRRVIAYQLADFLHRQRMPYFVTEVNT